MVQSPKASAKRCSNMPSTTPLPVNLWPARSWTTPCRAPTISRFYDLGFNGTRCATNPLGVKGCGEAGAIAAFPAIANAILDALAPLGVTDFSGPATPLQIWKAIKA